MKYFLYLNTKIIIVLSIIFLGTLVPNQTKHELHNTIVYVAKHVDMKQIMCMANNIFHEAGHESTIGQAAVAIVVLNRVKHGFGADPCKVIHQVTKIEDKQICQFSWVCEGKKQPNKNDPRFAKALDIAYDVMVNNKYVDVIPRSVLYFHNTSVDPIWPHRKVVTIGNHVFYAKSYKK